MGGSTYVASVASLSMIVTTKAKVGGRRRSKVLGIWGVSVCQSYMTRHVLRRHRRIISNVEAHPLCMHVFRRCCRVINIAKSRHLHRHVLRHCWVVRTATFSMVEFATKVWGRHRSKRIGVAEQHRPVNITIVAMIPRTVGRRNRMPPEYGCPPKHQDVRAFVDRLSLVAHVFNIYVVSIST